MLQMTIIFSLVLLLLLHACNATNLEVLHNYPPHLKSHFPVTKEKDEKLNPGGVSNSMQPAAQRNYMVAEASGEAKNDDEQKNLEVKSNDGVIKGSDFRKNWRLPHRNKRGENNAGFNLDYLPPKTHPPVHN